MKFRYYITDTFDGAVKGTDDYETAFGYACCDEYFVVDSETGMWLLGDQSSPREVVEIGKVSNPNDEEDE